MDKFVISAIISGLFVLIKILETKFIKKDEKPEIKKLTRDGLLVYIAAFSGLYLIDLIQDTNVKGDTPTAFIDKPEF